MRLRMYTLPVGRIRKPHSWRRSRSRATIIAHIDPQSSRFCLTGTRCQYRNRRVVRVDFICGHYIPAQRIFQWPHQGTTHAELTCHHRAIVINTLTSPDFRDAIQRLMMAEFTDRDMRQYCRCCHAALNRASRGLALHNDVTPDTRLLTADMTNDLEGRCDDI